MSCSQSEAFTPPSAEIAERFPISSDLGPHGTNGPVGSSFPRYQYPGVGKGVAVLWLDCVSLASGLNYLPHIR